MGFTESISEGGLFIATYSEFPLGAVLDVTLRLPSMPEAHTLRGEVRWVRHDIEGGDGGPPPGIGVQFRATKADQRTIRAFLRDSASVIFWDSSRDQEHKHNA